MFPCCRLCYAKYIEPNGTLDHIAYHEALTTHLNYEADVNNQVSAANELLMIEMNGVNYKAACTCLCHHKNKNVIH